MIGLRIGPAAPGRPGRVALLLGLVMLIAAHLAGTAHASVFAGPHAGVGAVVHLHHEVGAVGKVLVPPPGHDHRADGHIDHAVDRPRTAADDVTTEPGHDDGYLLPLSADTGPLVGTAAACSGAADTPRPPDGRSPLALHCVWRQ